MKSLLPFCLIFCLIAFGAKPLVDDEVTIDVDPRELTEWCALALEHADSELLPKSISGRQFLRVFLQPARQLIDINDLRINRSYDCLPMERERNNGHTIQTVGAVRVGLSNIHELFQDEYAKGKFGAKAIAGFLTRDRPVVVFFRSGTAQGRLDFHHRDVVALLERSRAEAAEMTAEFVSQLADILNREFDPKEGLKISPKRRLSLTPKSPSEVRIYRRLFKGRLDDLEKHRPVMDRVNNQLRARIEKMKQAGFVAGKSIQYLELMLDAQEKLFENLHEIRKLLRNPNTANDQMLVLRLRHLVTTIGSTAKIYWDHALRLLERAEYLNNQAKLIEQVRKQSSFDPEQLRQFMGFQMTMQRIANRPFITHLDVDSSVTAAQTNSNWIEALKSLNDKQRRLLSQQYSMALMEAHLAIDESLRRYRTIRVVRLKQLRKAGIELTPPSGYQLVDIEDSDT